MKNILFIASLFFCVNGLNAQITVTNTQTPNSLVQNILLGFGVTASNITVNGSAANAGIVQGNIAYFNSLGTTFPISSGVLLTTGNATAAIGPNTSGSFTNNVPATPNVSSDPHLNAIANSGVTNGTVLEFDFIPAGDTISFNYIFGSDEYPEFSPSSFNDAFGFFLWGPGISGPYSLAGYPSGGTNLAIIPGTTIPVTINNLGPGAGQYPQYYVNNLGGAGYGTAIQYDATTAVLSCNASVQCGETYHIKLAICNVGDQAYDSGVFLQANSFSSEAIQVAVATVTGDTSVYEACSEASLIFIRPESQLGDTMIVTYEISGTAIEGLDFNDIPNPVTFLPDEDTVVLTITPTADGFSDNFEYVTITCTTISQCGDTIVSTGTLYILDSIPIPITETDPVVLCANDSVLVSATATGLYGPYTYEWQDGQTGTTAYFPTIQGVMQGSVDYLITVTNSCGYTSVDTVTITLNQTLMVDTLFSFPATCEPIGAVSAVISGATGVPNYEWHGPNDPNSAAFINASVWQNLSSGWYYFTIEDDVCTANDSVFVDILNPPMAAFTATPNDGCTPLDVLFQNNSQNASNFQWDFGNGNSANVGNMDPQTQTYTNSAVVRLIASEGNCADTTYATITISICGCTDPLALNYDPTANIDDGSCFYPEPTVYVPNVFTPNNDGDNDLFFLTTTNSTNIELTIINRWGNVVFEKSGVNPAWDGKTQNGSLAGDGVYFYKYKVDGLQDQYLEGHGFLQLIRD